MTTVEDRGGFMVQSVLLLEKDPKVALLLSRSLQSRFNVHLIESREGMRENVAKNNSEAVVLNIEQCGLTDVENLHAEFPSLPIVCTHRIPDEEMWMAALEAGASDVCPVDDPQNVLTSVLRSVALSRGTAA
jgi:DNA-binding NtrC family response regulator